VIPLNPRPEVITDLSSLTRIQVETLKIHRAVLKGEINMDVALKTRRNSGISRGTHYRILTQAKKNVTKSLFTVAAAVQMGLLKPEEVQKLIFTLSMIPTNVNPEKLPDVIALVTVLADRIVMS
jgi:flagellar motor switch protein FliG